MPRTTKDINETIEEFIARGGKVKKIKTPQWQLDHANKGMFKTRYKLTDLGQAGLYPKKKR